MEIDPRDTEIHRLKIDIEINKNSIESIMPKIFEAIIRASWGKDDPHWAFRMWTTGLANTWGIYSKLAPSQKERIIGRRLILKIVEERLKFLE